MNSSQIPNLADFIACIDPENKIDIVSTMFEFGSIISLKSAVDLLPTLDKEHQENLRKLVLDNPSVDATHIYKFFLDINKDAELIEAIKANTPKATLSYIKKQLDNLPSSTKDLALNKFPELVNL